MFCLKINIVNQNNRYTTGIDRLHKVEKAIVKKILIVDNNVETRNTLFSELSILDKFRALSTDNARIAAKLIGTQQIDYLITELNLPEINGFKLLSHIKKHSPSTQAIAMTDVFSNQMVEKLNAIGIFHYLNKPVKIELLVDIILDQSDHPSGSLHGITLSSFLQLMQLEQKTCSLTLSTDKNQGVIHCIKGEIIGAQTGEVKGKTAFYKIMEWNNPTIMIKEGCKNTERQIDVSLMHLLMESHQAIDEKGRDDSETIKNKDAQYLKQTRSDGAKISNSQDLNYINLESRLSKTPGISNYEIFSDNNIILNETPLSNHIFKGSPVDYFSMGNTISSLVGGSLKYSIITRSDRSNYLIGKSNQYFIRATLKPGTKIADIIR
jgi:CheY-like chemotaxis protein